MQLLVARMQFGKGTRRIAYNGVMGINVPFHDRSRADGRPCAHMHLGKYSTAQRHENAFVDRGPACKMRHRDVCIIANPAMMIDTGLGIEYHVRADMSAGLNDSPGTHDRPMPDRDFRVNPGKWMNDRCPIHIDGFRKFFSHLIGAYPNDGMGTTGRCYFADWTDNGSALNGSAPERRDVGIKAGDRIT